MYRSELEVLPQNVSFGHKTNIFYNSCCSTCRKPLPKGSESYFICTIWNSHYSCPECAEKEHFCEIRPEDYWKLAVSLNGRQRDLCRLQIDLHHFLEQEMGVPANSFYEWLYNEEIY